MASPASKLMKSGAPALQSLVRHHLLRPSSAAASSSHLFESAESHSGVSNAYWNDSPCLENASCHPLFMKLNVYDSVLSMHSRSPNFFGFKIEAARKTVPLTDDEDDMDFSDDDVVDDDDDDVDSFHDDDDDDYSDDSEEEQKQK